MIFQLLIYLLDHVYFTVTTLLLFLFDLIPTTILLIWLYKLLLAYLPQFEKLFSGQLNVWFTELHPIEVGMGLVDARVEFEARGKHGSFFSIELVDGTWGIAKLNELISLQGRFH